jgi:hypothetical protein
VFLQTYGTAVVIVLAAVLLGHAICRFGGRDQRWYAAPAVGLAALIILEGAAIELPGRAVTAIVITVLVLIAAGAALWMSGARPRSWREGTLVAGLALLGASVPFVAMGHIGLPGVGLDNDTNLHLLWAEGLRSARMAELWPPSSGYPLGPHSVVAAVGSATGASLNAAFSGLLLAIVAITALVGRGVLPGASLWRRALLGLFCSLTYLLAAYYAEGAFKETIMALLLLGFVVHLEQGSTQWAQARTLTRWWLVAPVVLLPVAAVYTYSYLGLAWFAGTTAIWALVSAAAHWPTVRTWFARSRWKRDAGWALGALALALAALLPIAASLQAFFNGYAFSAAGTGAIPTNNVGNLFGPLSPYVAFGVWPSNDFRALPPNVFRTGELAALALAVFAYGVVWALRRRRVWLVAAVAASWAIWWRVNATQSPYVAAKALVVAAPLVMALTLSGLVERRAGPRWTAIVRGAVVAAFCAFAAYSSFQALRNEPVEAPETVHELASFHRWVGNSNVLSLGDDEFATWELRQAAVGALLPQEASVPGITANPAKPFAADSQLDFDSVTPAVLDRFRWVVTGSAAYSSQPPPNFRLVKAGRLYYLWERVGPTQPRSVIEPPDAPGAILDCRSPAGQRLRAANGYASVMATPLGARGTGVMAAGGSDVIHLALPVGTWELSAQYTSDLNFTLSAGGTTWRMPAYQGRLGPFFRVGRVKGYGAGTPVALIVRADRPSRLTGLDANLVNTYVPSIAATRVPDGRAIIPVSRACGRYVDWYRLR